MAHRWDAGGVGGNKMVIKKLILNSLMDPVGNTPPPNPPTQPKPHKPKPPKRPKPRKGK